MDMRTFISPFGEIVKCDDGVIYLLIKRPPWMHSYRNHETEDRKYDGLKDISWI